MKPTLIRNPIVCLMLCCWPQFVTAQTAPDAASFEAAQKLRADAATAVKEKKDTPERAVSFLKAQASPSGLKIDRDADFAFAAIDVGQRLIALGDPESAEKFFREAEKALSAAVKKTPDSAARDKAAFLQKLALVRGRFLNKAKEAKADLDTAIALQPGDRHLEEQLDLLISQHGPAVVEIPPKG